MTRTYFRLLLAFLFSVLASAACPLIGFAQTSGYVINLVLPAPPTVNISGTTISRILVIPTNGFTGKIDFACMITGPSPPSTCATPPSVYGNERRWRRLSSHSHL